MNPATLSKVQEYAAALTPEEKTKLLDFLLTDLQSESVEISTAWLRQIEESEAEFLSRRDSGVPWSKVQENMQRIINGS
jgi:hypothetical protein